MCSSGDEYNEEGDQGSGRDNEEEEDDEVEHDDEEVVEEG